MPALQEITVIVQYLSWCRLDRKEFLINKKTVFPVKCDKITRNQLSTFHRAVGVQKPL